MTSIFVIKLGTGSRNSCQEKVAEEFVNFLAETSTPKALTLDEIRIATRNDATLTAVSSALKTGNWHQHSTNQAINQSDFQSFKILKDKLCTQPDLLSREHRIVIPETLREKVIDIVHKGHMGMTKTKALLREKVWFPKIDNLVEAKVKSCLACQVTTARNEREPLNMSELLKAPWTEVSVDFGIAPTGLNEYFLVVIDDYSRFPIVELVPSTSAKSVIPVLDKIFSKFGIPEVNSDNGPPFNSWDFHEFSKYLNFHHRRVTPLWPRANGEVERFMGTVEKIIQAASIENKNWKQEVYKSLMQLLCNTTYICKNPTCNVVVWLKYANTTTSID